MTSTSKCRPQTWYRVYNIPNRITILLNHTDLGTMIVIFIEDVTAESYFRFLVSFQYYFRPGVVLAIAVYWRSGKTEACRVATCANFPKTHISRALRHWFMQSRFTVVHDIVVVAMAACAYMLYIAVADGPTVVRLLWLRYKSSFTCARSLGWH